MLQDKEDHGTSKKGSKVWSSKGKMGTFLIGFDILQALQVLSETPGRIPGLSIGSDHQGRSPRRRRNGSGGRWWIRGCSDRRLARTLWWSILRRFPVRSYTISMGISLQQQVKDYRLPRRKDVFQRWPTCFLHRLGSTPGRCSRQKPVFKLFRYRIRI
jgi:hypothetical protein